MYYMYIDFYCAVIYECKKSVVWKVAQLRSSVASLRNIHNRNSESCLVLD